MEANFWHERWQENKIGFHQNEVNPLLMANFHVLAVPDNGRVFVPLCGKTRDIAWLLSRGYRVVGVELSDLAIEQLFADLGVTPDITPAGKLIRYRAAQIDIYVGDIFDLTGDALGEVAAVYDRAALVALPVGMRSRYARHISAITGSAPQFLLTLEYDQSVIEGPPFSIDNTELARVHGASHTLTLITSAPVKGGLKGVCPATDRAWHLH